MNEVSFSLELIEAVNLSNEVYNSLASEKDEANLSEVFLESYNVPVA